MAFTNADVPPAQNRLENSFPLILDIGPVYFASGERCDQVMFRIENFQLRHYG